MSRNYWTQFALVLIVLITSVSAVVAGTKASEPWPFVIVIVAAGLVAMIGTAVYCAVEFNLRAHETPPAVAPAPVPDPVAAPVVGATPATPPTPTPVAPPQPAHSNVLAWVGGTVGACVFIAGLVIGGWYLHTYHPDSTLRQAAADQTAARLLVP